MEKYVYNRELILMVALISRFRHFLVGPYDAREDGSGKSPRDNKNGSK